MAGPRRETEVVYCSSYDVTESDAMQRVIRTVDDLIVLRQGLVTVCDARRSSPHSI